MRIFSVVAMGLSICGPVAAQDGETEWSASGDWAVRVDPTNGNGCLAQRRFDDGILVRFGIVPDRAGGFFSAYNAAWTRLEEGGTGIVTFDFGSDAFAGDVSFEKLDGEPGGYAFFDNPEFVTEFAKRTKVIVSVEGGDPVEISLAGTSKTIQAVKACQKEQK